LENFKKFNENNDKFESIFEILRDEDEKNGNSGADPSGAQKGEGKE
jgi:hypothetical protein